ncbi:hypothetical protein [Allomeiothermus silvanus]|uniref:hypothetical protein n=1 Tax=Allomeiothermus silvanus TaxID=52022 RepID=UPI0023F1883D|nr:hypothetical protein [Allomeiothermus silvanus]
MDGREWLCTHSPPPTAPERQRWSEEASAALQYLEQWADRMHYPTYKAQGWPIGSGQHGKGARMKRSGMLESRTGASRMAALRAESWSRRKWPIFISLAIKSPHF